MLETRRHLSCRYVQRIEMNKAKGIITESHQMLVQIISLPLLNKGYL